MKKKIMNWLGLADSQETAQTPSIEHAAAVLMVEIMRADDHWHDLEQDTIIELLGNTLLFQKRRHKHFSMKPGKVWNTPMIFTTLPALLISIFP